METEQEYDLVMPRGATRPQDDWIGVIAGRPKDIPYPFEIRVRYTERGTLVCAGLRIGEGTKVGSGYSPDNLRSLEQFPPEVRPFMLIKPPKSNITSRMLSALPLGDVLRYIQGQGVRDEGVRNYLELWAEYLAMPPEGRSVVPGQKGHPDSFYIHAAERFKAEHVPGGNAEVYRRLASELHREESVFRRHVRRGWKLRPDLKPEDIRTRSVSDAWTTKRLTRKTKPKEETT